MQIPNLNHFSGQIQTMTRSMQGVGSNRNININLQKLPSTKKNYQVIGSPYFNQQNLNPFYEKTLNEKQTGQDFQTKASFVNVEHNEQRREFISHKIDNKYGLEVRKIEKTPRNSHTDNDLKVGSQKNHPTYQKLGENQIQVEKRSIDYHRSQITQIPVSPSLKEMIYLQSPKSVNYCQKTTPAVQYCSYQNMVIPKNDIKVEKEIIVKEFPKFKKESNNHTSQNQLRETNKSEREVIVNEVPISQKENNPITQLNQVSLEIFEIEIENVGIYEGSIRNNSLYGFGKLFNTKKHLVFEGEFADNNFEGVGIQYNYVAEVSGQISLTQGMTLPSCWTRFEGLFHENKRTGMGTMYFLDGSSFCGQFGDDEANGFGSFVNTKGEVIRGVWKNNTHISR